MRNVRTLAQFAFLFVRPIFPFLQWLGRVSGRFTEAKTVEGPHRRQPYLVGCLKDGITVEEATQVLKQHGFFLERVAYPDPGQTLSMRRLNDEHPDQQYHVRLFSDGEMRGHLEYTPEDRPIAHMEEELFEEHTDLFRTWASGLLK